MNPRKTDKADLEKKKGLYLQIGIVLALSMVWMAFEWKTFESGPSSLGTLDNVVIDDDMIATNRKPPPPPPPPPAVIEIINIVDDKVEIDEIQLESTEFDDDEDIELIDEIDDDEIYNFVNVESRPIFPGCENLSTEEERSNCFALETQRFVLRNFEFPEMAIQMGIQGKVWVEFVVDKSGLVTGVAIVRGVDKLLDDEALRVVKKLPRMKPAKVGGRSVSMRYSLPINARLQ
jgi:protein TonB